MEELQSKIDNFLENEQRNRVFKYYRLLYPDLDKMSFDERWYAEWSKIFISEHLDEMDERVGRIRKSGDINSKARRVQIAYRGLLTDHYYSIVEDSEDITWDFISENLDDVNKKYLDRWFYCSYNSESFDSKEELTTIVGQIKKENRAKKIEN